MEKRRKLIWYLFPSYFVVTLFAVAAMAWEASHLVRSLLLQQTISELQGEAFLVSEIVGREKSPIDSGWIDPLCKRLGPGIASRVTVMLPSGKVVGDSADDLSRMDDHSGRPEVRGAIEGKVSSHERYSAYLGTVMVYVAAPVMRDGTPIAIVRTAMPIKMMATLLGGTYRQIVMGGVAIVIVAALMSLYISYRIKRPLSEVKDAAARLAAGDLDFRVQLTPASQEMSALVESINTMAAKLRDRIQAVTVQRNQLEAILTGMTEAVILVDPGERIILVNRAAIKLFGISDKPREGRYILEVIRNNELREFFQKSLASESPLESDILMLAPSEKAFQAHGTKLRDACGKTIAVLLVLNDVTRIKELERIRRDFVANASHELKTPLTSIIGFLETLKEGAIDDPQNARRFLEIIMKNAARLNRVVEDLLTLSRMEEIEEKGRIRLSEAPIGEVLAGISEEFTEIAKQQEIELKIDCQPGLSANINPQLLETAISNLVENALRVSRAGSSVTVSAVKTDIEVAIRVVDHGRGIPAEHIPRIFERFYRTGATSVRDKAGSGLGLSITKHVVNAHKGRIEVESELGHGSTFTIYLPAI